MRAAAVEAATRNRFNQLSFRYENEGIMTKAELIDVVALESEITKVAAEKAINSFASNVQKVLRKGDKITLTGFGTFQVSRRKARKGLNPQTKKAITIPACRVPKFKAGKSLKAAVR